MSVFRTMFMAVSFLFMLATAGCGMNDTAAGTAQTTETTTQRMAESNDSSISEKPRMKVKFQEVVRSMGYVPHYVALGKGFYEEEGLDIESVTSQGGDVGTAALVSGRADIILAGPETAIYIHNSESPAKVKIFATVTQRDHLWLISREKLPSFSWDDVKGKTIIGWRPGSTPQLSLEYALKKNGVIPGEDTSIVTNIEIPARAGAFISGEGDFAIMSEPIPSQFEQDGTAWPVASIGLASGKMDFSAFEATDKFIAERPEVIQAWANGYVRGRLWMEEVDDTEIAKAISEFFPTVSLDLLATSIRRMKEADSWAHDPAPTKEGLNRLQEMMVEGGVLQQEDVVAFEDIATTRFAEEAMKLMKGGTQ